MLRPTVYLLLLGGLWGLAFSLAKIAITQGVPPLGYVWWQSAGAGVLVLAICAARGTLPRLTPAHVLHYGVTGALGIAFPNACLFLVIDRLPAGTVALMSTLVPLMTYGLSLSIQLERFHPWKLGGLLLGLLGAAIIAADRGGIGGEAWLIAIALLGPLGYAATNVFSSARTRPPGDSLAFAGGMLMASALLMTPLVLALGAFHRPVLSLPVSAADWAILGQIVISSVAYMLFFEIIRIAGGVFFSQTGYVVGLMGMAWGFLLFGERPSALMVLAVVSIFAGLALVNRAQRQALAPARHPPDAPGATPRAPDQDRG